MTGSFHAMTIMPPHLWAKISPEKRQIDINMHLRLDLCTVCQKLSLLDAVCEKCEPQVSAEMIVRAAMQAMVVNSNGS